MQKFKFNNPSSVVAISKSPLDKAEAGNPYTIYDCYCHLAAKQGQHAKGLKKTYQITATSVSAAARTAIQFYRKDYEESTKAEQERTIPANLVGTGN